jgi:single-strand DNA-binding protein
MNRVFIIGNLTKDPELRTTNSGISKCSFTVAVQRRGQDKQADFIPVVAWRGLADNCGKYLAKGRQVAVCGSIQTRSYDTASGDKRYVTEVVADEVQFLSKSGSGGKFSEEQDTPMNTSEFEPVNDLDDLPF